MSEARSTPNRDIREGVPSERIDFPMMRSLFSAISGMRNHMAYMDVVGNNIANVNTTAYKSARVTFQDIMSQTIRGASSPQNGRGGTNPAQIGLGMTLGSIDNLMQQGSLTSTGKLTD